MNSTPVIVATELTRKFGSFTAVDRLSISVQQGEVFGFLGANGAGKTTAIRMFCGLLAPSSGEAMVNGFNVNTEAMKVKRTIGYMSQKFSLYDDLTVNENIELYGGLYGVSKADVRKRGVELLEQVGLENSKSRLTSSLPLGFKQRLALGCAMLHRPAVLFLDEPTSGVDPIARRKFWELIYQLAENGTTVFVTTHYMDEAEYCNRISIMAAGKLIALDTPNAIKQQWNASNMQDAFLKIVARDPVANYAK